MIGDPKQNRAPVFRQAWLLTFGDLLTLMLCFFIALCSFQRFGEPDESVNTSNHGANISKVGKSITNSIPGTAIAISGNGGPLSGLMLSEDDFLEQSKELSEEKARELSHLVAQAVSKKLTLEIESCALNGSEMANDTWDRSEQRASTLQRMLIESGVPEQVIRVRILGPYCELIKSDKENVRMIVRGV